MTRRQYPCIGRCTQEQRWAKLPAGQGPRCVVCGNKAHFSVHIEVSWFRGDDEVVKACGYHKSDAGALLTAALSTQHQQGEQA
jgi:hypothetical protein